MYLPDPNDVPNAFVAPADLVQAMLNHGTPVAFKKGQMLISAQSEQQDVFWVQKGKVQVAVLSPSGKETILRIIEENQCFGEMAAIGGGRRSANVIARTDGLAMKLTGPAFLDTLRHSSELSLWFLRLYTQQIRDLTDRVFELSTYGVAARLHSEILRLVMQNGRDHGECVLRRAPTHAELAARIGTNRESVTREMGAMADAGLLKQKGRSLTVFDVVALRALVASDLR